MSDNLLQIITISVLTYLGYLAKFYLPNYFKKKAENLAQSQDIEKLTNLVREVEYKFEERTQTLKAKLDLVNHLQLGLHNEERAALISLHNTFFEYQNFLCDISLGGISFHDNVAIQNHIHKSWLGFNSLYMQKNKVMLFLSEEEYVIHELVQEIGLDYISFRIHFIDYCEGLISNNKLHEINSNEHIRLESELISNHAKNINDFIDKTVPKLNELSIAIKEYLKRSADLM